MVAWNCAEAVRTLRTERGKHFFRRNGEESCFPDPRTVPWFARCPNCPNCLNCPKSSRFPRRLSLLRRSSFGGWNRRRERAWGYAPHTRSRSETCTTRKLLTAISRMLCDHRCSVGTVRKSVSLTLAPFHGLRAACHGAAWRSRVRMVRIVGIVR